eukprot:CAMPEP_0171220212 /NCGR_PEP_ID=MMETSP0790-20130122/34120_1 /TAXON_ID=2925 /ORGANISM="Alexandrium catenella, Strain OF101" /LENGTH=172 /DNA_ID=CAMNT_0011686097 /DNA_START=243 /DNA_END=762 /DNA_ORIENTATION=-
MSNKRSIVLGGAATKNSAKSLPGDCGKPWMKLRHLSLGIFFSSSLKGGLDDLELVLRGASWEERPPADHLCKDAADRPDVDGLRVVNPRAEDLGGAVPPSAHVFRHRAGLELLVREAHAREAKVRDLEIAIRVDEQIPGLQVSVDHPCGMHILHATEQLVEEELVVVVRERL